MFLLEVDFPQAAKILGGTAFGCGAIYYMFWHCCFKYVRQVVPQSSRSSERSQKSRWGSVRYLSFRKNRLRRAAAVAQPAGNSTSRPDIVIIEEGKSSGNA